MGDAIGPTTYFGSIQQHLSRVKTVLYWLISTSKLSTVLAAEFVVKGRKKDQCIIIKHHKRATITPESIRKRKLQNSL